MCFTTARITSEKQKYGIVAQSFDPRVAAEVHDLMVEKPPSEPYTTLKTQLISRLSTSQEQKTRRLLEMKEMADRKPSQFLRHLKSLAGTAVPEAMLCALWFNRLQTSIQKILAAQKDLPLDHVAELADSIMDLTRCNKATVAATAAPFATPDSLGEYLTKLRTEVIVTRTTASAGTTKYLDPEHKSANNLALLP